MRKAPPVCRQGKAPGTHTIGLFDPGVCRPSGPIGYFRIHITGRTNRLAPALLVAAGAALPGRMFLGRHALLLPLSLLRVLLHLLALLL